jgi:hypothetical protein
MAHSLLSLGMANYYHVRISLFSGTQLEAVTVYKLSNAMRRLESWTGQPWPYQVIHRALKASGCWAQAHTQSGRGSKEAGTYSVARCVVVSIEDAGELPEYSMSGVGDHNKFYRWQGKTCKPPGGKVPLLRPI